MQPMPTVPSAPFSRRSLLLAAGGACSLPVAMGQAATSPELTVTEALRQRRSVRTFSDRMVDPALLAELLWAGFGINRGKEGLHTAPSWRGAADVIVHAATADGVVVYDPGSDAVRVWKAGDIRAQLSPQPFVATAPVCLILVSDLRRLEAAGPEDERRLYAMVDAAMVSENAYLFAAARGLGTCLVGGVDRDAITQSLGLAGHEFPTFVQPVGWPA
ncbi:MAG: hypothetical protein RL216_2139 [Pseudomonadota bacterium]|jgi:nitroreductase